MAGAPNSPLGVAGGFMVDPNAIAQQGQQANQANQFGKQFGLQEKQFGLAQQAQDQGYGLAEQQLQNKQNNRNQAFGLLSKQLGQGTGFSGGSVPVGPIWSEGQIQQHVNAARGQNDAATAGRINQSAQQLSGRGFGSNSPLQQALAAQYQGQNLGANTADEENTRWTAAQGNAQQVLQGATANAQLAQSNAALQSQRQNSIISALAGLS